MPPKTKQTSAQTKCKTSTGTRRSSRLSGVDPISYKEDSASVAVDKGPNLGSSNTSNKKSKKNPEETSLPRARETSLLKAQKHSHILGIDEAGRGPLAGPVVTAACYFPPSSPLIPGIGDSKTITDESERERLYEVRNYSERNESDLDTFHLTNVPPGVLANRLLPRCPLLRNDRRLSPNRRNKHPPSDLPRHALLSPWFNPRFIICPTFIRPLRLLFLRSNFREIKSRGMLRFSRREQKLVLEQLS